VFKGIEELQNDPGTLVRAPVVVVRDEVTTAESSDIDRQGINTVDESKKRPIDQVTSSFEPSEEPRQKRPKKVDQATVSKTNSNGQEREILTKPGEEIPWEHENNATMRKNFLMHQKSLYEHHLNDFHQCKRIIHYSNI
jgi:hypothetical protein